ncbi:MAG: YgjV family protein [Clostridia bacterium]|nr:YgjV family protein [Clostridia bacterium]
MLDFLTGLDPWYVVAQVIGLCVSAFGIFSFQQKQQKGIAFFQMINSALWVVHMFMLNAISGGAMNAIGVARGAVFSQRSEKKWAQSPWWFAVFCALVVGASVLSWVQGDGWLALLPMVGMIATTFALGVSNPFHVRLLSIVSGPCWLAYNIIKGSIPGVITEIFVLCSIVIGIIRIDLPRMREKK